MADEIDAEGSRGAIYAEAPLKEIERYIKKVHGGPRNLTTFEVDVLAKEVNAQMRVIRMNWPVETGTSRLAWFYTINGSAKQMAVIFQNPMWYAGFVTRKDTPTVKAGGAPWFTVLLPAVWKANKERLNKRLKAAIDKTERQQQQGVIAFDRAEAQKSTNLLAKMLKGLNL